MKRWTHTRLFIAVSLCIACPAAAAQAQTSTSLPSNVREDPADGAFYLYGNLTWKAGASSGGIAWQPNAPTIDPGGCTGCDQPSAKVSRALATAGMATRDWTGDDSGVQVVHFVSDALPTRVFLNVSRWIQFWVFVKTPCNDMPRLLADAWVGDTFLGGSLGATAAGRQVLAYCGVSLKIHSEIDVLPEGASIRVDVSYALSNLFSSRPVEFGMAENHQSALWIPFYPPEEAIFRNPHLAGLLEGTIQPGHAPSATPLPAAGAMLAAAVPGWGRRHRTRAMFVMAALVAMSMAGCTGGAPGKAMGPEGAAEVSSAPGATSALIPDGELEQAATGRGTVIGTVADDQDVPLPETHVSVLGQNQFTQTNRYGRFFVYDLLPATYTLRFQKEEHRSLEHAFTVEADQITRIGITLPPIIAKPLGLRMHKHAEQWGDQTSLTLFDGVVSFTPSDDASANVCARSAALSAPYSVCRAPFVLPAGPGSVVPPGTSSIEVYVNWSSSLEAGSANTVARVGFGFVSNLDDTATIMSPRASGQPTQVQTSWEMTDRGHQKYTSWQFFIYLEPAFRDQVHDDQFHVDIRIHKGVVPLEAPHRDFWQGLAQKPLPTASPSCRNQWIADYGTQSMTWSCDWTLLPPELVAPGTGGLAVTVNESRAFVPNVPWKLYYHAANDPPDASGVPSHYVDLAGRDGDLVTFHLPVTESEADPFYQPKSLWRLHLRGTVSYPTEYVAWQVRNQTTVPYFTVTSLTKPYPTLTPQSCILVMQVTALRAPGGGAP